MNEMRFTANAPELNSIHCKVHQSTSCMLTHLQDTEAKEGEIGVEGDRKREFAMEEGAKNTVKFCQFSSIFQLFKETSYIHNRAHRQHTMQTDINAETRKKKLLLKI